MKILYITDSHLKERPPKSRVEGYFDHIHAKHMEFAKMCLKVDPDEVWHGGDLFDGPDQSIKLLLAMHECITKSMGGKKRPWHVLLGNHPWRGRWEDWSDKSALTALERLGLITLYHKDHTHRASHDITIHMEHLQMVETPKPWKHTLFKDYAGPGQVFLVSDYHPFQGHQIVNGVHFISPGAVSRGSRAETDITREPCAALITIEGPNVDVRFLKFKSALTANEVIITEDKQVEKSNRRKNVDEAVECLKGLQGIKIHSIEDVLALVSEQAGSSQEVIDICQRRLNRSGKSMKT